MKDKEFRELQLSSTQLIIIFFAILVLGIFIFLLGVNVGKKQGLILAESGISTVIPKTEVPTAPPSSQDSAKSLIQKEVDSHQRIQEKKEDVKPAIEPKPAPPGKNLFYVQVGAFEKRDSALSFARNFTVEGFPVLVLDPFPSDTKTIFRVRIGGFPTREEAEKALKELTLRSPKSNYFILQQAR